MSFDYSTHARAQAEAPRWIGFPEFNFIGGHNDGPVSRVPFFRLFPKSLHQLSIGG